MDFKEAYKNANNSIHADRALIDRIYIKAQQQKKTKVINYSIFGSLAAAAAVFVLVFNAINMGSGKINGGETYVAHGDLKARVATEEIKTAEKTEKNVPNDTADLTLKQEQNSKAAVESTDIKTETVQEDVRYDTFNTTSSAVGSLSGASDIAMAGIEYEESMEDAFSPYESYTANEYYDYIGSDVISVAKIPSDMKFEKFNGADITKDENGSIIADTGTFIAYDALKEKSITIEVTKIPQMTRGAALNDTDGLKTVQIVKDDLIYTITAFNVTDGEIDELVASLQQ